jgi:riboflavin kinase/FMN adenylyltransferase
LSVKAVVVGDDFRFGQGQQGDGQLLWSLGQEHGFEVHLVPAVELEGVRVSTTHVRGLLEKGDVNQAATFLGRDHSTVGIVVHGLKNGRKLGYPTANLSREAEGMLPKDGVYAGWLYAGDEKFMAALSVGTNESVTAVPRVLEAHVLDRDDLDLYDQVVKIEYVDLIRPNLKISGIDELVTQIGLDVESARAILTKLG